MLALRVFEFGRYAPAPWLWLAGPAIGAVLALRVFEFGRYAPDPWLWLAGPAIGLLCVAVNTWLGARAALGAAPIQALREA